MLNEIIRKLNKLYRECPFVTDLLNPVTKMLMKFSELLQEANNQIFFDKLTLLLPMYEKQMKLNPTASQTQQDRQSSVEAHWKTSGHNYIGLLQNIAESWKKGETIIDFVNGRINIKFTSIYGVPMDLKTLIKSFENTKPAHLGYGYEFKYLLKKDIHNVMTKTQMESHLKNDYTGAE